MGKNFILKVVILFPAFVGLFIFLPAGSFRFWEGWIYSFVLFIPLVTTLGYLVKNDPELLKRRLRLREKEPKQKRIVGLSRIPFILGFLIPGFDYRFNWSEVPMLVVITANILVFLGYWLVFLVFRENSYTSRIVEVEKNQTVITTGPYSVVRHPMYTGIILMYLFTPIALGSWWALLIFGFTPVVLILRIFNEEELLKRDLAGYNEYCQKVRYRLMPYVW